MALKRSKPGFVDISSNTQVTKIYKSKGKVLRIVSLILSIVLVIAGSLLLVGNSYVDTIGYEDQQYSGEHKTSDTTKQLNLATDEKVLNIMLFGEDKHSEGTTGRSDSLMLLSIDTRNRRLKLTSFQRDTLVNIPGYGDEKITSAYSLGGAGLAIQTVEANFGVKVDRYAVVDFDSFEKIVDSMGGIEMTLSKDEVEYINWQMYINKQVKERHYLEEKDGKIKLNGREALWYARDRGYDGIQAGDDWDRTERQRKFLQTVVARMKKASFSELMNVITSVGPYIKTNLKKSMITNLASHALTFVKYPMIDCTVPMEGLWSYLEDPNIGSCIQINDMKECRKQLAHFIYKENRKK